MLERDIHRGIEREFEAQSGYRCHARHFCKSGPVTDSPQWAGQLHSEHNSAFKSQLSVNQETESDCNHGTGGQRYPAGSIWWKTINDR